MTATTTFGKQCGFNNGMIENTSYIVLSRQLAMRREMDVIANNVANMNTTSFKSEKVLFEEFLMDAGDGSKMSFVRDFGTVRDLNAGEMERTANPLDIAISGKGYLTVETDDGPRYTRAGTLRLDDEGNLTIATGERVLDDGGNPIQLDPTDSTLDIATDGTVSNSFGPIGRLGIVAFENEQALTTVGGGLYQTDEAPEPYGDAKVIQGMLEGSNVEPILEVTRMIELSRAYQSTANMMQRENDMRRRSIERLGRVS